MGWFSRETLARATMPAPSILRLERPVLAAVAIDLAAATALDFVRVGEAFGPADEGWWTIVAGVQVVAARADCPMVDVLLRDEALGESIPQKSIVWLMSRPAGFRGTSDGVALLDSAGYAELTRGGVRETVESINAFPRID